MEKEESNSAEGAGSKCGALLHPNVSYLLLSLPPATEATTGYPSTYPWRTTRESAHSTFPSCALLWGCRS